MYFCYYSGNNIVSRKDEFIEYIDINNDFNIENSFTLVNSNLILNVNDPNYLIFNNSSTFDIELIKNNISIHIIEPKKNILTNLTYVNKNLLLDYKYPMRLFNTN